MSIRIRKEQSCTNFSSLLQNVFPHQESSKLMAAVPPSALNLRKKLSNKRGER